MATDVFVHQPYDSTLLRRPAPGGHGARRPAGPSWTDRRGTEADLVRIVVDQFRGYAGSLPSERLQNVVKATYPTLYAAVVDARYRRRWNAFLQAHPTAFTLAQVPAAADPAQPAWRLYLAPNAGRWWAVDAARRDDEAVLRDHLAAELRTGGAPASIDAVVARARAVDGEPRGARALLTILAEDPAGRFVVDRAASTIDVR